jgi:putative membrane protein
MKKMHLTFAGFVLVAAFASCSNNTGSQTTSTESTTMRSGDTSNANTGTSGTSTTNAGEGSASGTAAATPGSTSYSNTPLKGADSIFVMKAAMGGMTEVQGGQTAQQNAQNDRVKNFGQMMVNDHGKSNQELMSIASAKGMTIPSDLSADKKKMVDQMKSMKGASFDKHYMGMMVTDHKKDIADFEKASKSATDPDVKAFASKTLPVLRMHLDSAQAINSGIK